MSHTPRRPARRTAGNAASHVARPAPWQLQGHAHGGPGRQDEPRPSDGTPAV